MIDTNIFKKLAEEPAEEPTEYSVYIRVDPKTHYIIDVFSDAFEEPDSASIYIDKGSGDKYAHAQGNYFSKPLISEECKYNYKYEKGLIKEI